MYGNGDRKFRSPAKAGVYFSMPEAADRWTPACAGERDSVFAGKRSAMECSE
jgi:hypothetical protein